MNGKRRAHDQARLGVVVKGGLVHQLGRDGEDILVPKPQRDRNAALSVEEVEVVAGRVDFDRGGR